MQVCLVSSGQNPGASSAARCRCYSAFLELMEPAGCYAEARLTCRQAGATKGVPPEATESHLGLGYMHVSWLVLLWSTGVS